MKTEGVLEQGYHCGMPGVEETSFWAELAGLERNPCGALNIGGALLVSRAELSSTELFIHPVHRAVFWDDCHFPFPL